MSNIWNAEKLVVGTLISDNIRNSSGEKYSTPESSNTKHQVGEQWISMDGTIPFGGIPFLGQQVSTEVYNELYNWAVENERMISETEWQSLYSSQNGNVPYYAYGEDATEGRRAWLEVPEGNYFSLEDVGAELMIDFNYYNEDENGDYYDDESFKISLPIPEDGVVTEAFLQSLIEAFNNIDNVPVVISDLKTISENDNLIAFGFSAEFKDFGLSRHNNNISILTGSESDGYIHRGSVDFEDEILPTPATQFRMPLYKGYLKAQTVAGSYIAEGLPNITGSFTSQYTISQTNGSTSKGAIVTPNSTSTGKYGSTDASETWGRGFNFDASKSNSIYGASTHVTPETNTMLIGVYAFNEITNPAVVNSEDYRKAISTLEINVTNYTNTVDSYTGRIDTNENNILKNCPVGCIMMYAKSATPNGWLTCNGASINRETYKDLFNVIGTTFGAGDGSTTFALPNLTNKFAMGNDTVGTAKAAGLPNITGALNNMSLNAVTPSASGAFTASVSSSSGNGYAGYNHPYRNISFNASRSSSIYGAATTVQPPALTLRFIIKY